MGQIPGFLLGEYRLNPGPELVTNSGFEQPGGLQVSGGWHRDTTISRSGKASLRCDVSDKVEFHVRVPLKPNAVYRITFYMKSEGLNGQPTLHVRRFDARGQYIRRQANINYLGIYSNGWVRSRLECRRQPTRR